MRIIGGKYRGRVLKEFKGKDIRPTGDRAREALFNILQYDIVGSSFYDAFCGTGAVAIEAISRGAKKVVMTDSSPNSIKLAKENLALVKADAEIRNTDAVSFLKNTVHKFDIIFLDPPYDSLLISDVMSVLSSKDVLNPNGVIIAESDSETFGDYQGLIKTDVRKYGKAIFTFYKRG